MGSTRRRTTAAVLLAVASIVTGGVAPSPGRAGTFRIENRARLSGTTPLPACGRVPEVAPGTEYEPHLAVNPRDRNNIVITWKQDSGYGARTNVLNVSHDGGRTWQLIVPPGQTECNPTRSGDVTDPTADSQSDPWVTFLGDGTGLLSSSVGYLTSTPPVNDQSVRGIAQTTAVDVVRSTDNGRSWHGPQRVAGADNPAGTWKPPLTYNDRGQLVADSADPKRVFASWFQFDWQTVAARGTRILFSTGTRDTNGITWTAPEVVVPGSRLNWPVTSRISRLPSGRLLLIYDEAEIGATTLEPDTGAKMWAKVYDGTAWSDPIHLGGVAKVLATDPENSEQRIRIPSEFTATTGRDGTTYVGWMNTDDTTHTTQFKIVRITEAPPGNSHLAVTEIPSPSPQSRPLAVLPTLAVSDQGALAAMWYDTRHDTPGDGRVDFDVWLAHTHNDGRAWEEMRLTTRPFNLNNAPRRFSGHDYLGLAAIRNDFVAVYTVTHEKDDPDYAINPTDVYFARVSPDS